MATAKKAPAKKAAPAKKVAPAVKAAPAKAAAPATKVAARTAVEGTKRGRARHGDVGGVLLEVREGVRGLVGLEHPQAAAHRLELGRAHARRDLHLGLAALHPRPLPDVLGALGRADRARLSHKRRFERAPLPEE